ncbi:bacterioferritin-associated ferredoxin [Gallaecimonas kandeliae]|uniref:bacterioferritin-associated ferredoxin n=1 Tax=Gallaecimonas kandeliae TaxID=3029055 RepID=UPI00264738A3|nr:bacterioferritin-associated ferredoxin [Gallaecimonas kandeliae]WKE65288.1 bacterioferritin-associated ferredoxin [Gallaecimonas kandeliae]
MYVCLCHGVSDKAIRKAAHAGCHSLAQLRAELKVASQCGKCARQAKAVLSEALPPPSAAPKQTLIITQIAV